MTTIGHCEPSTTDKLMRSERWWLARTCKVAKHPLRERWCCLQFYKPGITQRQYFELVAHVDICRTADALKWSFIQKYKGLQKCQRQSEGVRVVPVSAQWETLWKGIKTKDRMESVELLPELELTRFSSPPCSTRVTCVHLLPTCVTHSNMIYLSALFAHPFSQWRTFTGCRASLVTFKKKNVHYKI